MATTKKASTGTKAGAGARTGATKANGVANETKSKPTAKKTTAPKKAVPVKLNDRQREFLKKIKDAGEHGYEVAQKVEQRTINALMDRKLLKRGSKNKETGHPRYLLTKAAAQHLPPAAPAPSAEPAPAPPAETSVAPPA